MAFRPVFRIGDQGRWVKMTEPADIISSVEKELEAQFNFHFNFDNKVTPVYFAMSFPYSYDDLQRELGWMEASAKSQPSIYFKRELLVKSFEGRRVDIITISSQSSDSGKLEERVHPELFPIDGGTDTSLSRRFEKNKLIIFLTARVHPGETPASYAMKGTLEFLMEENNPLAKLLREFFVFKIIPMINPDGVYRGHFRTDGFGRNLNRYYRDATLEQQPSVFAIVQLINYFEKDKRIFFFCDYHAHGSCKNHFFYGNSLGFVSEVEARTFAKILEANNQHFKYDCCDFSPKQMDAKESNPLEKTKRTKEQCSRVATYRYAHLIHSFTLELGYHEPKRSVKTVPEIPFSMESFMKVGKDLMISLLDLFDRNPQSKLLASLETIRKEVADSIKNTFKKKEGKISQKVNKVHEMIEASYYQPIKKRREEASFAKPYSVSVNVAPRTEENIAKCPSQDKPRFKKELLRPKMSLNHANQLNKSLTENLHITVQDNPEQNTKNSLKISSSILKEEVTESKNRMQVVKKMAPAHSKMGQDSSKNSYLPDLTIHRKVSTTKILEADEIFGFNRTSIGISQAFTATRKKEPMRIMSNKTLEEIKSPVKGNTVPILGPIDRKEEEFLFPTYFNARLRYPKEEEIVIAKAINGGKLGYRTNLRSMKLKAVQDKLLAEKGVRGFFNIKNQSKENSRDISLNIEATQTKRRESNYEEALNELKDSLSIVEPGILGINRSVHRTRQLALIAKFKYKE